MLNGRHSSPSGQTGPRSLRPEPPTVAEDIVPVIIGQCFLCGEASDKLCQWCRLVFCCSSNHFRVHRNRSKCGPYIVLQPQDDQDERGRRLIASRNIRANEFILIEDAVVIAPAPNSMPVCPICLKRIANDDNKCAKCEIPVCQDPECVQDPIHGPECRLFSENKVKIKISNFENPNSIYSCIGPVRMMALQSRCVQAGDNDLWCRVSQLMDHSDERKVRGEWNMFQLDVVDFVRKRCFLQNKISQDELHRLIGVFVVNGVSLESRQKSKRIVNSASGKAIFPTFSLINHDCLANSSYTVDTTAHPRIVVRARRDIPKGEEITVQYLVSILGTHKRRKRLKSEYYFDCKCQRCSDPSECHTFVSALACEVCERGFLLPDQPLEYYSQWRCNSVDCGFVLSVEDVERKIDRIEEELTEISSLRNLTAIENFVNHYSNGILHPNHYLILLAKRNYLFISRKELIELMANCSVDEQAMLRSAFKQKQELFREFSWVPERLFCCENF